MKSLNRHFSEICTGGWPVLRWKILVIFEYLLLFIGGLWAIPVVLLIRCLRPWRIIRFGPISSSRIGSFAIEIGRMWATRQRQSKKYLDLYWFNKSISNVFWAAMVRRNFYVYSCVRYLDRWNQILPGGAIHNYPITGLISGYGDIPGFGEAKLPFLPEEDVRAKAWLRQQGWKEGDPFVCLLVRDSSYLESSFENTDPPQHEEGIQYDPKRGYGWNHLNYRDTDIDTYVAAAEWLADQGVWVFRMGKVMAKPIHTSHPRIIDYAFHPDKSDFLDIWLFAHCDLCISTGTGPDIISDIYRKPILFLNYIPLKNIFSWSNAMHLSKTLVWKSSGIPLNLREYFNNHSEYYDRIGIKVTDLTSEEILAAVQERWQRLQGTWIDSDDDIRRHHRFWEILTTTPIPDCSVIHGLIHPESRVGAIWLRSKGDEFLE